MYNTSISPPKQNKKGRESIIISTSKRVKYKLYYNTNKTWLSIYYKHNNNQIKSNYHYVVSPSNTSINSLSSLLKINSL